MGRFKPKNSGYVKNTVGFLPGMLLGYILTAGGIY